ncbi:MAG: hypothetical protein EAZ27_12165 [Cytophagales bacterium]|nr:MAG: hypothetical protein EAZ27_12165 [Cytophagales bacterium]
MFAQTGCPEAKEESYKKVMSSAFAKDYEKCPVIITAEYFGEGYLKNYRKPSKIKKMYFFQCVNIGDNGNPAPLTNEISGDFFVIDKTKASEVLDLKKGNKLKLTGTTFTQNYMGIELSVFFIVTKVEIIQ